MTTLHEAAQQALDCILASTEYRAGNPAFEQAECALIEALKAALAQQGEPETWIDDGGWEFPIEKSSHVATGWVAPKDRYAVPVLFNPYTGEPRDVRDVQSDPQGVLIVPPGKVEMLAAAPAAQPDTH